MQDPASMITSYYEQAGRGEETDILAFLIAMGGYKTALDDLKHLKDSPRKEALIQYAKEHLNPIEYLLK